MQRIAYIMRGLPGSGKSAVAGELYPPDLFRGAIYSTDEICKRENMGKYIYDQEKVGGWHEQNIKEFKKSCEEHIQIVICDNTNILKDHFQPYIDIALQNEYMVHILTVGDFNVDKCVERNKHGVPRDVIQKMKDNFEL